MKRKGDLRKQSIQKKYWENDKGNRRNPEHPVIVAIFDPLASLVASLVENPESSNVLDVGCGNGFLSLALEKRFSKIAGLDYSRQMLNINPCRSKYLGLSTALPFSDKSFDIVVASHLLHHLVEGDRIQTLNEMKRVARVAIVSFEPNRNNPFMFLFSLLKKEERMILRFSQTYMRKLFEQIHLKSSAIHIEGWIVPNKTPVWWIPIARFLEKTPIRRFGFEICSIGML
ncbi:MAG: class I SAM-dependent methyltransferase [Candidatus Scalindua sp.]